MVKEVKVTNINEVQSADLNSVERVRRLITREREGSEKMMLGVCFYEPGGEPFRWMYPEMDEVYYVTRGRLTIFWEGKRTEVKEGDAVLLPAGIEYATINEGTEPAMVVYVVSPPKF